MLILGAPIFFSEQGPRLEKIWPWPCPYCPGGLTDTKASLRCLTTDEIGLVIRNPLSFSAADIVIFPHDRDYLTDKEICIV